MKKTLFIIAILTLALSPSLALASPGLLDQYGGHICQTGCLAYGLADGEYHFHDIPAFPNYLSGDMPKQLATLLFYVPRVVAKETATSPASMAGNEDNIITQNVIYDNQLCKDAEIFASGRYTAEPKVRVSPVCANRIADVLKNSNLSPASDYYKELPSDNTKITKVYHYIVLTDGRGIFTDRPEISELKGLIVQGVTDSALYYVSPNDETLTLRPITAEKAVQIKGTNYKSSVVYFDDSIIYSYSISRPLL